MKAAKWNTPKVALYGAPTGAVIALVQDYEAVSRAGSHAVIAYVIGGAIGGAALFALVSGARNLFVR